LHRNSAPKSPARRKITQTEKAYQALKTPIVRGQSAEGQFLVESEITRSFAIGRTPYREAWQSAAS
jgi:DNA-binding GntR family transcriptional regulator